MKKILKGKHVADVEEVKLKTAEALKRHQNRQVQTLLSSAKKVSVSVVHQVESTLKVTEV